MNLSTLKRRVTRGEGPTLEFKRSTGELREALQTVCAFLNGDGGSVILGGRSDGRLIGQEVSDQTLRDLAQAFNGFEPPAHIAIECIQLGSGREVLTLHVDRLPDTIPFTFEGRAYERIQSSTRRMSQRRYEQLLLERAHSRRRWENQEAEGTSLQELNREEVFQAIESARAAGRLVEPVGRDLNHVLDRLGVRRGSTILRAAVVLFGKRFLPDFPQCELRMARFKGTDKTEFLDQRQIRGPAFQLLEEALLFCQRHLPLPGRIEPGRLERADRPLISPDALREILVNALIHRDYTITGGAVALAIFDDRVEVWSAGWLPSGITVDDLSRERDSIQRNPLIADVFYRAGLIEKWGRGTNRVIIQCAEAGIAARNFEKSQVPQ
jgi:ATP-dependent DNA helicase RecG